MTVSISGISSSDIGSATQAESTQSERSTAATQTDQTAATTKPVEDTVQLSMSARAHLLKRQGESVHQIAVNLGITAKAVSGYLGVTQTQTASPAAAQVAIAKPAAAPTAPKAESSAKS
jgi:pyruvate/2-oxoglutarate dehydrogenase complex dihydrolipoamide acyltransferase (E2) component